MLEPEYKRDSVADPGDNTSKRCDGGPSGPCISRVRNDHLSGTLITARLARTTRNYAVTACGGRVQNLRLGGPPLSSCLSLHRVGFACTKCRHSAGALLPHPFTLTCGFVKNPSAVCFLLHFPWGHPPWPLASTLPCGVPTFLRLESPRPSIRLFQVPSLNILNFSTQKSKSLSILFVF